jgi:hypothetical protein
VLSCLRRAGYAEGNKSAITTDGDICRERLARLASSRRDGIDPRAAVADIVKQCRPSMDAADIAALLDDVQRLVDTRDAIVSARALSEHNWRLAVMEGAADALK